MRRPVALIATALFVAAMVVGAVGASAAPSDTKGDRDRVRAEKAAVAAGINTLKASQAQVEAALATLQANVATEEGRLADAKQAVAAAKAQIAAAEKGIAATTTRISGLRDRMTKLAIDAYVRPNGSDWSSVLEAESASDAAQRDALRSLRADRDADVTDKIRSAKAELEAQRRAADDARKRAEKQQAEVDARLATVKKAKEQQQKLVDGVKQRLEGQIKQSIRLAAKDKALSTKLALEQAALQARLADAAAARASGPGYGDGGSEDRPLTSSSVGSSGGIDLCTVGGITVSCQISGRLSAMLAAARKDGVNLSGGGWRDPSAQIALRREHCGTSHYAIYEMSPSACHPPTARPGQSMHEVGLAIDFSPCGGGSPCNRWLRGHAASYGFYNLPSESWHWSVNGN